MAYPGDPSGPASKGAGPFAGARLTTDDFEQLAAAFRPSWEFDEAPFTGAGSLSPADLRALQGGGTHADVRAAVQVAQVAQAAAVAPIANGSWPVPKAAAPTPEPEESIIVERPPTEAVVQPQAMAQAPVPSRPPPPPPPPVVVAAAMPASQPPPAPERLAQTRIVKRPVVQPVPIARESTGSFDVGSPFAKRSKKPLWIGLGAGAAVLGAIGIWAMSGGADHPEPAAATIVTVTKAHEPPAADIPPPPATTAPVTAPPPAAATVEPRTVSISALAQVPAPVQATARSAPAAPPAAAPAPRPAAPPAPKPAARPKAGSTIVHDVPF